MRVSYKLTAGAWAVDSAADPRTELVAVEVTAALGHPGGGCRLVLYAPPAPAPGLLEQAAGAALSAVGLGGDAAPAADGFSVQVRGQPVAAGDPITVELAAGGRAAKVMTAVVHAVRSSLGRTTVVGRTALHALAAARVNQVYENQPLDRIVADLAGQAGVRVGTVAAGAAYPYYVAHESRTVLDHVADLAAREGFDVTADADDKLVVKAFDQSAPDLPFHYGIDLLDLALDRRPPAGSGVRVYGESPATQRGAAAWHWLAADTAPFRGAAGGGAGVVGRSDPAVRTKDAADRAAAARFGALTDRAAGGHFRVLGNPTVRPGDAVEIKGAPPPELNGVFKVASVRHVLSRRAGFVTHVGFTGRGGGAAAGGGLLGAAAGALAGAVGL